MTLLQILGYMTAFAAGGIAGATDDWAYAVLAVVLLVLAGVLLGLETWRRDKYEAELRHQFRLQRPKEKS